MKTLGALFLAILLQTGGSRPTESKPQIFIALFSLGAGWDASKPANQQPHFKEHSANLQRLRAEKKILIGGRYADKGMVLIQAADLTAAQALFDSDPMVSNQIFKLELHPYAPFYTGCVP